MKIMFSAGEASGDMHAAAVAEMIKQKHPHVRNGWKCYATCRSSYCI